MTILLPTLLIVGILAFILTVRQKDLPEPVPASPFEHLDERKAAIYESLRDLQFEYRLGKMSDHDYQATKGDLQRELAGVLAEIDQLQQELGVKGVSKPAPRKSAKTPASARPSESQPAGPVPRFVCEDCKAEFSTPMKFCGECGKPMGESA